MVRRVTVPSDPVAVVGRGSSTLIGELVDDGYMAIIAVDIAQSALDQLRIGLGDRAESVTLIRADARTVRLPRTVTLWHDKATFHFLTNDADEKAYAVTATSLQSVFSDGFELIESFERDHVTPSGAVQRFVHALMIRRDVGSVVE